MINFLLGAPGAGKSYEAVVFHVLPSLNSGRKVITNLPLNIPAFESIVPGASELIEVISDKAGEFAFSRVGHYKSDWRDDNNRGPLYVIDEAHKPLPRSTFRNANGSRDLAEWYAEHRHYGVDVLLITQSYGKVNRDIVDLVQVVWRCRKNIALGSKTTYVRKTLDGVRGAELATTIRKYKKEYFKLYQSHTASSGSVDESGGVQVRPIWMHWSIIGSVIFLAFSVFLGFTGVLNPFPDTTPSKIVSPVSASPVSLVSTPVVDSKKTSTVVSPPEVLVKPEIHHPYENLKIHAGGVITKGDERVSLFIASQNGQRVFVMRGKDLVETGYQLEYLSDCAWLLSWGDWQTYVTCDNPSIGVSTIM